MTATNTTASSHYCIALAANVSADHRCSTCFLDSKYQDELRTTALLRAEVARLNALATRKAGEACELREALKTAERRIQRLTGEKDFLAECFESAKEAVEILERKRDERSTDWERASPAQAWGV